MNVPDLNFLYVLQALYEEKSVSRAADRLGLTQPAVSHALGKLRTLFHDELFVRAGLVMAPTEIGERVAHGAIQALSQIQHDIWDARTFNPLSSTRTFSVCLSDMGMITLLPRLLSALQKSAPNASLKPIQLPTLELAPALQDGAIDLAIGYLGQMASQLYQQSLFRRSLVGIMRNDERPHCVTFDQFVSTKHVLTETLALSNLLLDDTLKRLGARLTVGIHVPNLLTVPNLVAASDHVACVPDELATYFAQIANIRTFRLPVDLPDFTVKQFWHARFHNDMAHRWFRKLVYDTLADAIPLQEANSYPSFSENVTESSCVPVGSGA